MSELAADYYREHAHYAREWQVPRLLRGKLMLVRRSSESVSTAVPAFFARCEAAVAPLDTYVRAGVPQVLEARYPEMGWTMMRQVLDLPPHRRVVRRSEYIQQKLLPPLVSGSPAIGSRIWLQAVAPEEVPETVLRRVVAPAVPLSVEDADNLPAQALFVGFAVAPEGEVRAANCTMVWADPYIETNLVGRRTLSVRYLGAQALKQELPAVSELLQVPQ